MERTKLVIVALLSLTTTTFPVLSEAVESSASASSASPTRSTSENLSLKRYVSAGDRAYEVGVADGTFAPMGFHITGHMNGVWTHPIEIARFVPVSHPQRTFAEGE